MAKKSSSGSTKKTGNPAPRTTDDGGLPSEKQILEFLNTAQGKAGKREIARAFGIKGGAKIALKRRLAEMSASGHLSGDKKDLKEKGRIANVTALEVTGRDRDGDLLAKPLRWEDEDGPRPLVRLLPAERGMTGEIGIGDRVLARVSRLPHNDHGASHQAVPIKKLEREQRRLVGIYRASKRGGGTIEPISRKDLKSWAIAPGDDNDAKNGDLVRFELTSRGGICAMRASTDSTSATPTMIFGRSAELPAFSGRGGVSMTGAAGAPSRLGLEGGPSWKIGATGLSSA